MSHIMNFYMVTVTTNLKLSMNYFFPYKTFNFWHGGAITDYLQYAYVHTH